MKRIYFTVTNDLSYDQRMQRICDSLVLAGYKVMLVGRKRKNSKPLQKRSFDQKRLRCLFDGGFLFYAEYNIRLFIFLLFQKMDAICAIDLDTILPCLLVSKWKGVHRIYDAHEYFTELKEVRTRPFVYWFWKQVEKVCVPRFRFGYTVSEGIATAFRNQYNCDYILIRNLPVLRELPPAVQKDKYILYQGAVNEGRGLEYLVPAMKKIPYPLVVCGDGNFMGQLQKLIRHHGIGHKVDLMGMLLPEQLFPVTRQASLGIGLAEKEGLNQYHALPNKFFDYLHAGLPQVTMNFPEYAKINAAFPVAVLLDSLDPSLIASTVNELMQDEKLLFELRTNCMKAREVYCWQAEEKNLVRYYEQIFQS